MSDTEKVQKTRVKVYNHEYTIRSSQDPSHMQQIARLVDDAMRGVAKNSRMVMPPAEIAVLVALHFASEATRAEADLKMVLLRLDELTNALSHAVEDDIQLVGP